MFEKDIVAVSEAATAKWSLWKKNPVGYLVSAMIAGGFISFGGFITFVMGTPLHVADSPMLKFVLAFCFSAALCLVISAGAELFTGNNMVMAIGTFMGKIPAVVTAKLSVVCWVGNLLGSVLVCLLFRLTGVPTGDVGAYFGETTAAKMALTPLEMFTRGILCNILVCLAVWCSFRLKSETAKLIMAVWCILVFMICGGEHCVANMSIMLIGLMDGTQAGVTIGGYLINLLFVTLGNVVGGVLFVALPYFVIAKKNITNA